MKTTALIEVNARLGYLVRVQFLLHGTLTTEFMVRAKSFEAAKAIATAIEEGAFHD